MISATFVSGVSQVLKMKDMYHSFHVACFGGLNHDTGRQGVAVSLAFYKIRLNMKDMLISQFHDSRELSNQSNFEHFIEMLICITSSYFVFKSSTFAVYSSLNEQSAINLVWRELTLTLALCLASFRTPNMSFIFRRIL